MAGRDYSSLLSLKSKIRPRFFQLLHTVQRISEKKKKKKILQMSIDAGCLCKFEFRFDRIGDVESINEDRIRFFFFISS